MKSPAPIPSDTELVKRLAYREWNEHALRWVHERPEERWFAYYNGCSVAGVSTKLSKHWDGYYTWMLGSRLGEFPESVEQGKEWIERLWWAWIKRAFDDHPQKNREGGLLPC